LYYLAAYLFPSVKSPPVSDPQPAPNAEMMLNYATIAML
jgi:hypothetical protein